MFDKELLKQYVEKYKENINDWRFGKQREIYKWEAVEHFKKHWDIDAPNFAEMLKEALRKTENLLTVGMFFPKAMLFGFASKEPETVRKMFRALYDEEQDLGERVSEFIFEADELHKRNPGGKKHFQGTRAISIYLWLNFPNKYYIYQHEFYNKVVKKLESDYIIKGNGKPESMIKGFRFFDEIRDALRKDNELIQLNLDNGVSGFKDEGLTTLTQDIGFFISEQNKDNDKWYPTLKEYDPQISAKEWINLYNDEEVFDDDLKRFINQMMLMNGEATCKQLAEKFLGDENKYNEYNSKFVSLGKRVQKKTNRELWVDSNDKGINYWSIFTFVRKVNKKVEKDIAGQYIFRLRDELKEALIEIGLHIKANGKELKIMPKHPKNLILYGPPGTGKTYNTVNYAVAIIENKTVDEVSQENRQAVLNRYKQYREEGLIEFCTFHQSFGYEEFIEGIKPAITEDNNVIYKYVDGIFKAFCEKKTVKKYIGIRENPTVWKIVLSQTTDNHIKIDCLKNNHIRIGYVDDETYDEIVNKNDNGYVKDFVENMVIGDIVVVHCYPKSYEAIGIITSEFRKDDSYTEFKQVRDVSWILNDGNIRAADTICDKFDTRATVARVGSANLNEILKVIEKYGNIPRGEKSKTESNRVFIIDEINRGNISKIFGELITLIEEGKRIGAAEEMRTRLPYSGERFGVPNNIYILGTMNTADRSIALIDTALRRRFKFVEMQPNTELLDGVIIDGVDVKKMLTMINRRIEVLYDREHTIGHSFFMGLTNESNIDDLAEIFECSVIPLLKEYFYDDCEKVAAVLGDSLNSNDTSENFITKQDADYAKIFGSDVTLIPAYRFNVEALKNPQAYKKIYEAMEHK